MRMKAFMFAAGVAVGLVSLAAQPEALPTPGFHQKDQVENYLHAQVCSGAETLQQAQQEIATNWLAAYQRMTGH